MSEDHDRIYRFHFEIELVLFMRIVLIIALIRMQLAHVTGDYKWKQRRRETMATR